MLHFVHFHGIFRSEYQGFLLDLRFRVIKGFSSGRDVLIHLFDMFLAVTYLLKESICEAHADPKVKAIVIRGKCCGLPL